LGPLATIGGDRVRSLLVDRLDDPPGELGLGAARKGLAGKLREHVVDDPRRPTDRVELAGLLEGPKADDDPRGREELEPVGRELGMARHGQVVSLEGDRRVGEARQVGGDPGDEVALDEDDVDALDGARRVGVAPVRHEHDVLVFHEHKCIRALETGQITDVDGVGGEERSGLDPVELGAQPLDARVHEAPFCWSMRNTSASR
jgi:hypothetical protein